MNSPLLQRIQRVVAVVDEVYATAIEGNNKAERRAGAFVARKPLLNRY